MSRIKGSTFPWSKGSSGQSQAPLSCLPPSIPAHLLSVTLALWLPIFSQQSCPCQVLPASGPLHLLPSRSPQLTSATGRPSLSPYSGKEHPSCLLLPGSIVSRPVDSELQDGTDLVGAQLLQHCLAHRSHQMNIPWASCLARREAFCVDHPTRP